MVKVYNPKETVIMYGSLIQGTSVETRTTI